MTTFPTWQNKHVWPMVSCEDFLCVVWLVEYLITFCSLFLHVKEQREHPDKRLLLCSSEEETTRMIIFVWNPPWCRLCLLHQCRPEVFMEESAVKYCNIVTSVLKTRSVTSVCVCVSERGLVGVRSRRLLLQKSDALFQHPHLRLVPLHHRHHLRLQLLQFVLVLLLGLLVRRHQITAGDKHTNTSLYPAWAEKLRPKLLW